MTTLPADATGCRFQFSYFVNDSGDDSFSWSVMLDGTNVLVNRTEPQALDLNNPFAPATLGSAEFAVPPGTPANPHVINVQFVFHAGNNGASPALVLVLAPELGLCQPVIRLSERHLPGDAARQRDGGVDVLA